MQSVDDLATNLAAAETLVRQAAETGAEWIALPEMFAYLRREGQPFPCAQSVDGDILATVGGWAKQHRCWILAGSIAEARPDGRVHNTSVMVSPEGKRVAVYRKMHLFDVDLSAHGGQPYAESASIAPGEEIVVAPTPFGGVGLSICYDVRFPELYRALLAQQTPSVRFLAVPSAFAPQTGQDHWEVLLRARAIENQCFVVAPAQWGQHTPDRVSYGRSVIIDPWGLVLATAPDGSGVIWADCDLAAQDAARARLPVLSHRRL